MRPRHNSAASLVRGTLMGKARILIIDDEVNLRAAIREVLEYAGYEAAEAGNGPQGLTQAETIHPDVILLDVGMEEGNGYELCRRLKSNPTTRHIPVLLMTGKPDATLHRAAEAVGALGCLRKPFRLEALLAAVQGALTTAEGHAKPEPEDDR